MIGDYINLFIIFEWRKYSLLGKEIKGWNEISPQILLEGLPVWYQIFIRNMIDK
jgi:hypothetical protein